MPADAHDHKVKPAPAGAGYEPGRSLAGLPLACNSRSATYRHAASRPQASSAAPCVAFILAVWGLLGYGLVGDLKL